MRLEWKRVPSVRYGGKAFFFVAHIPQGTLSVAWNRIKEKWIGKSIDHESVREFDSPDAAIQHFNKLFEEAD